MALSNPRAVFGIHSIVPYDRTTKIPFGIIRVLGGGEISLEAERIDLFGGSNRFPFVSEAGRIDSEFTFTAKEYPDFMFELFLGATVVTTAAEAGGSVNNVANVTGTTALSVAGVAGVSVDTAADLKFGTYLFVADSATTGNIFVQANIDAAKGAVGNNLDIDDTLVLVAGPFTIVAATPTNIAELGVDLDGGAGAIAMTIGDSFSFEIFPIHTGASTIQVGKEGTTFPEFAARMMAAKLSDGRIFEINAFRANGSGMPIGLTENEFAEPELTIKLLFDSIAGRVFDVIALDGQ